MSAVEPILRCINIWKVFGPNAKNFMQTVGPDGTPEEFARAHLVAGVRDVNLDVHKGEIFVVMGLSGSGKSTLVRCMTGLHEATHGNMIIDGADIAQMSGKELITLRRKKINMVFQDFALLPHLTVIGNVAFPLRVQGVAKDSREKTAQEMIELVGLKGREDYYPHELSGGQQQRVGIARSLMTQPEVWFLDEPFSALDPMIRYEMQTEFLRLQGLLHKSIVFVTHDFDEAVRLADRMAIMKDGRIIQMGTPEELLMNPATDYVRDFTRSVPKPKVLRIRTLMTKGHTPQAATRSVDADAVVADVAAQILDCDHPVPVREKDGTLCGSIHRRDLIDVIV